MYGITEKEARNHDYNGDMQFMPVELARQIYKKDYWDVNNCDAIAAISEDVAFFVFDTGINMGVATAAKMLQTVINLFNYNQKKFADLIVDCNIGGKTIAAIRTIFECGDKAYLPKTLEIAKGARYIDICKNNSTQEVFFRGWINRCNLTFIKKI